MRLTKTVIDKLLPPTNGQQALYRDDKLKGFALRVTAAGTKSFVVEKRVQGKLRRITLGRFGELTVEQARKEAQKVLGQIATGVDPQAKKQAEGLAAITLQDVFQDYLTARKALKPKTLYDYQNVINRGFADWKNKPLLAINKDKVARKHSQLGKERGEAYANLAMRLLRALFNFAEGQYEDAEGNSLITQNPVKRLSQTRAWYRIKRRQTYIKPHELAAWHRGVMQLSNHCLRDYLLLILFTGLRRSEAAQLKWTDIDLKAKTLIIHDTKNHEAHTLPLSDFLFDLLCQRRLENTVSEFVFPGPGRAGHIIEPRKQTNKVTEASGVTFTIHDLRRTFITVAESLDISTYAVKRLVNHKMNNDVTAGYIVSDVGRLRQPMERISKFLLKSMKVEELNIIEKERVTCF